MPEQTPAIRVCVPVTHDGQIGPRWGRADRVAITEITSGRLTTWEEYDVGWHLSHGTQGEGAHHASVVRFLREHDVTMVVAGHMGHGMQNTLTKMGLRVWLEASGDARSTVIASVGEALRPASP